METKHTPGPWKQKNQIAGRIDIVGVDEPHFDIAEVIGGMDGFTHNARLIAAAPDMLEALRGLEFAKESLDSLLESEREAGRNDCADQLEQEIKDAFGPVTAAIEKATK